MKLKLAAILFLLGMFLLISTLSLFDIFYPSVESPNFYVEKQLALQKLAVIRISGLAMAFTAIGLYLWALADVGKK